MLEEKRKEKDYFKMNDERKCFLARYKFLNVNSGYDSLLFLKKIFYSMIHFSNLELLIKFRSFELYI